MYSRNPREKIFFLLKFFDQSEFEKKWISIIPVFPIRIDRPVNTDAEKILLTLLVLSKSARKNFFIKIFRPIRIREKMKFNYSIFFSLESTDQSTLMLKKFYWPLLYCRNPREKISFLLKFFRPIRIREKIKFNYSFFFSLESKDQWTLMLKKSYWPLLYCQNPREKFFFFSKFLDQSDFEKKWNSIIRFFCHWNRKISEHWCWINYMDLCSISQIGEKNCFFYQNFSTNQNSRKIEIQLFDFFSIWIERPMNTDAKKIILTFVVFSYRRDKFFFCQNFWTTQNSRKNQIQLFHFFSVWIERPVNTDGEKILFTFVVSSKSGEKIFFL